MEINQLNKEKVSKDSKLSLVDFSFHLDRLKKLKENAISIFHTDIDLGLDEFLRVNY